MSETEADIRARAPARRDLLALSEREPGRSLSHQSGPEGALGVMHTIEGQRDDGAGACKERR
jgi:hypothetical protein